jgi:hypothetical protein
VGGTRYLATGTWGGGPGGRSAWLLFGGHHCGGGGSPPGLCGQWEGLRRVARTRPLSRWGGVLIRIWGSDIVALLLAASWWPHRRVAEQAPCLGADDSDTQGCRALLEDVVVVLLSVSGLRLKTFVRCGLSSGDALRAFSLLGAL